MKRRRPPWMLESHAFMGQRLMFIAPARIKMEESENINNVSSRSRAPDRSLLYNMTRRLTDRPATICRVLPFLLLLFSEVDLNTRKSGSIKRSAHAAYEYV